MRPSVIINSRNMIESKMTANTGSIAIGAICITSIPHLSILCNDGHWQDANERITLQYKEDMLSMLVNGESVQGVGNIQIELAKRPLHTYN